MSRLPVIPKRTFDVKSKFIPKGKITLLPFTVGVENLLLEVKDSESASEKLTAVKQVIQACNQSPDVDIATLPTFVVEEIFLRLRQNSVGELIEQQYQCTNALGASPTGEIQHCNTVMPIQIDTREFKIIEDPEHTNVIVVSDPIGIKFRYPSLALFDEAEVNTDDEIETIISCIDSIFDAENVYPAAEHTREELKEFWKQLTLAQKTQVYEKFFQTMPRIHYKKQFTCKGCGHVHTIEFNSIQEVFQ